MPIGNKHKRKHERQYLNKLCLLLTAHRDVEIIFYKLINARVKVAPQLTIRVYESGATRQFGRFHADHFVDERGNAIVNNVFTREEQALVAEREKYRCERKVRSKLIVIGMYGRCACNAIEEFYEQNGEQYTVCQMKNLFESTMHERFYRGIWLVACVLLK